MLRNSRIVTVSTEDVNQREQGDIDLLLGQGDGDILYRDKQFFLFGGQVDFHFLMTYSLELNRDGMEYGRGDTALHCVNHILGLLLNERQVGGGSFFFDFRGKGLD